MCCCVEMHSMRHVRSIGAVFFFFTCLYFTEIQGVLNMAMGSKPLRGIKKKKKGIKANRNFLRRQGREKDRFFFIGH